LLVSLVDPFTFYGVIVDDGTLRSEGALFIVDPFTFYGVVVDDGTLRS
jgi:hypothetical protein